MSDLFHAYLEKETGLRWISEFRFHPQRKWRFDYAQPDFKIAVEIEGGIYIYGRHSRGKGYERDLEKYNAATVLGWRVLRFTPKGIFRDFPGLWKAMVGEVSVDRRG